MVRLKKHGLHFSRALQHASLNEDDIHWRRISSRKVGEHKHLHHGHRVDVLLKCLCQLPVLTGSLLLHCVAAVTGQPIFPSIVLTASSRGWAFSHRIQNQKVMQSWRFSQLGRCELNDVPLNQMRLKRQEALSPGLVLCSVKSSWTMKTVNYCKRTEYTQLPFSSWGNDAVQNGVRWMNVDCEQWPWWLFIMFMLPSVPPLSLSHPAEKSCGSAWSTVEEDPYRTFTMVLSS